MFDGLKNISKLNEVNEIEYQFELIVSDIANPNRTDCYSYQTLRIRDIIDAGVEVVHY